MTADLARRAVACPGWRWMRGMIAVCPEDAGTVTAVHGSAPVVSYDEEFPSYCTPDDELADLLPDLTDPATLGCLLALVREAWRDPHVWTLHTMGGSHPWLAWRPGHVVGWGATEAEALVAALESAPGCDT